MPTIITTGSMAASAFGFARNKIAAAVDSFFNYVTLLLNGDAANGASGTFISDASTNAFALTANGSPINSGINPFQAGYYSNNFNGSSYLNTTASTNLSLASTDYTVECWVYANSFSGFPYLVSTGNGGTNYAMYLSTSGALGWGGNTGANQFTAGTISLSTWNHVAVSQSGSNVYWFVNGSLVLTKTTTDINSANWATSPQVSVGSNFTANYLNGYISNARIVKGTAVYTSNFTPSTTPLTAISGTSLLTCQSNRFIDNSSNNYTLTVNGSPTVSQNQPFTYTAPVTYGAGSFVAANPDYLVSSASQIIPTGSYTLEAWVYTTSTSQTQGIFAQGTGVGDTNRTFLGIESNGGAVWSAQIGSSAALSSFTVVPNTWTHVAMTFNGSTITLWVNGVSAGTASTSNNASNTTLQIGKNWGSYIWNGYISNARISNTVRYTTTFTPQTTPFVADANTRLLTTQNNVAFQNNTFVDSSANNFPITRNGNTTQGSFSPYGNLWSNYFNASGSSYLSASTSSALAFSGDFTVEGWINLGVTGVSQCIIVGQNNNAFFLRVKNTNGLQIVRTGVVDGEYCNYSFQIGVWYSFAVVRQSGVISFFINGVQQTTQNAGVIGGYSFPAEGTTFIGRGWSTPEYFTGYISNVRATNGTALYTANYTPATAPLSPISGTTILSCQSNRFIDTSTNGYVFTANGSPTVQRFSPFNPTSAYSTSVIGGAGYFDGSSSYLTSVTNSAFNFGSGAFTIEAFFYTASTGNQVIISAWNGSGGGNDSTSSFEIIYYAGTLYCQVASGTSAIPLTTTTWPLNQWNHIVLVANGSTMSAYLNGTRFATTSFSSAVNNTAYAPQIGTRSPGSSFPFSGYIASARIVKGTAVYDPTQTTLTVPTTPLTAITNTSLLANMTNAGIPDLAEQNALQTVGSAQVSTSVKKYGTGSLAFNGSTDYLISNPANANLYAFGSGDFTIEFWLNLSGTGTYLIYDGRPASTQGAYPTIYTASGVIYYYVSSANRITGPTLSTSTWYYVTVCRSGTSTKMFINGTQAGSTYTDSTTYLNTAGRPVIGADGNSLGTNPFNGYIDDLRVTNGVARYTANFTPPTAALPTY